MAERPTFAPERTDDVINAALSAPEEAFVEYLAVQDCGEGTMPGHI